ncbi:F0F1 ATP synthase subunit delta, partial [Clostridioides difficile]|uniref:F0F1 ATP synthase subunit delta n=1 Tax=Clostridioides difficile TaxID=1496 RepID=UPI003F8CFA23
APAAQNKMPIILSSPKDGVEAFDKFIRDEKVIKAYVIGGTNSLVSKSEKKNLVEIIFSKEVSSNIKNFLKVLVDKDRISYLED